MNPLGIYFGPKIISIVQSKGRKLANNTEISQSAMATSAGDLEEKVPAEVKTIEIIALFKDELRRNRIEAREATLCLSGKDLIIRTFEMPIMPKEEMQSAINFEVKKYIPFKAEELVSDFQVEIDRAKHSSLVLYMGIKKETLDRYLSILSQLNLKVNAVEYSAFSMLRYLSLSKVGSGNVVALVGIDSENKDEANFIVTENGFPLFSRDISLSGGPEDLSNIAEVVPGESLEKLKTEIRVSLDYYHRKFPQKEIKKIFLFASEEQQMELKAFFAEIGVSVQFADLSSFAGKPIPYSLNFVKGFSASLRNAIRTNIRLDLLSVKSKVIKEKAVVAQDAGALLQGLKVDFRVIILSLLICIAPFGIGIYQAQPINSEIRNIVEIRPQVKNLGSQNNYEELKRIDSEYKGKLAVLDNLVQKQVYATELLDAIPRLMPKGIWLKGFLLSRRDNRLDLNLEGMAYLEDSNQELEVVNSFVSNLKNSKVISKAFKEISVTSLDRREMEKVSVTSFFISCKTPEGRR